MVTPFVRVERKGESMKEEKMVVCKKWHGGGASDAVYGFGLIGALIYFLPQAASFTDKLLAIGKAFVWPAFVIFKLLEFLKV
jgi:hypothetical protein